MTHGYTESWTANKRPAWLARVQDKFRKQEMQERNLNLDYMTKLTNTANMIRCKRTASSLNLIGCLTPTVDKTNANRTNPRWQSREETISDTNTLQIQAPQLWSRMNYHGWARWQTENWINDHQMVLPIMLLLIWLFS